MKGVDFMTILKKIGKVLANMVGGLGAAAVIYLVVTGVYSLVEPEKMARLLKASTDDFSKYK